MAKTKRRATVPIRGNPDGITSITFEALNGRDEMIIWERVGAQIGNTESSLSVAPMFITEHMVMSSIVEVDGEAVPARPHLDWQDWESRTRSAVREAYDMFAEGKSFTEPADKPANESP